MTGSEENTRGFQWKKFNKMSRNHREHLICVNVKHDIFILVKWSFWFLNYGINFIFVLKLFFVPF